jgi:hypothetical protein
MSEENPPSAPTLWGLPVKILEPLDMMWSGISALIFGFVLGMIVPVQVSTVLVFFASSCLGKAGISVFSVKGLILALVPAFVLAQLVSLLGVSS